MQIVEVWTWLHENDAPVQNQDISEDEDMNDIPPATQEDEDDEDDEGEDAFEEMEDVTVSEAGNTEDYDAKHVNFRYTSTIYI